MIVGYARVSTDGQTLEAQIEALQASGAVKVFQETASGAQDDRRQLAQAIKSLNAGDVLLVTRIDRLARSTRNLLNTVETISKRGACFKSLAETWADTTAPTPTSQLVLAIFGALAEFERSLIVTRTSEGRARARAKGRRMGRKPKLSAFQQQEALAAIAAGELTQSEAARRYGVAPSAISRLVAKESATHGL